MLFCAEWKHDVMSDRARDYVSSCLGIEIYRVKECLETTGMLRFPRQCSVIEYLLPTFNKPTNGVRAFHIGILANLASRLSVSCAKNLCVGFLTHCRGVLVSPCSWANAPQR